jgi:hypothetical protein
VTGFLSAFTLNLLDMLCVLLVVLRFVWLVMGFSSLQYLTVHIYSQREEKRNGKDI